jgi:osmoprotectant transport system permease protein
MSNSLGFNNTYALAVSGDFAKKHSLSKISDLVKLPDIKTGFSHEFMKRPDGYPALVTHYGLNLNNIKSLAHSLAYEAMRQNEIELMDVYSTDAKIEKLHLLVLEDDKKLFPNYFAVLLARKQFVNRFPKTWAALRSLEMKLSEQQMIELNAMADIDRKSFNEIASSFLNKKSEDS